jgi:putative nucleotidyltransferase with HDIG domain
VTAETQLPVPGAGLTHLLPTRLDRRWLARRAARLDPKRHPSVSPSARIAYLLRAEGAATGRALGPTWRTLHALDALKASGNGHANGKGQPAGNGHAAGNGHTAGSGHAAGNGHAAEASAPIAGSLTIAHSERRGSSLGVSARSMAAEHRVLPERSMRTGQLLAGLSAALDRAEGHQSGHALRTCYLAMRLAHALQLTHRQRGDVFYAALLKDAGGPANASAMTRLLGGSEIDRKRDLAVVDPRRPLAGVRFAIQHAADEAVIRRLGRVATVALRNARARKAFVAVRADGGAGIARELGFSDSVCETIVGLDERWDGRGEPAGLRGGEIPLAARIVAVADAAETFRARYDEKAAERMLRSRRRSWYDPEIIDVLLGMARFGLWQELVAPDLLARTVSLESEHRPRLSSPTDIDWVAVTFASIIDGKASFSAKHSLRVGNLASLMAIQLGIEEPLASDLRRAGLLHDLGKLAVPNTILDKTSPLDANERAVLAAHASFGAEVLGAIEELAPAATLVAHHHDPLDGSGFAGIEPRLEVAARVVAVADLYDTLTAERPYPHPVAPEKALEILARTVGDRWVPLAVEALRAVL